MSKMTFETYLHPEFNHLVIDLYKKGIKVCLVGGSVRDYFLSIPNKHDYDVEIRFLAPCDDFESKFKELSFTEDYNVSWLDYDVLKLIHKEFSVELTLPRSEEYIKGANGHKNFKVKFKRDEDFSFGVKRRDFSINAMYFVYDGKWSFFDPLNAKSDLENKILKICSGDFYKDPVRFLRAVRFKIKFDMNFDNELESLFKKADEEVFKSSFLQTEAIKSKKPLLFLAYLFKFTQRELLSSLGVEFLKENEDLTGGFLNHLKMYDFLNEDFIKVVNDLYKVGIEFKKYDFSYLSKTSDIEAYNHLLSQSSLKVTLLSLFFKNELILKRYNSLKKMKVDVSDVLPKERKKVLLQRKLNLLGENHD